jgi:hypothetical protein
LVTTVVAGSLTALVSVWLARHRFRSDKWWERKAAVYSELFEGLFHVQTYNEHLLQEVEEGARFSEDRLKELAGRSRAGREGVRRAAVLGTFVLSSRAADRLTALVTALDDPKHNLDLAERIAADLDIVVGAISDLRTIAKRDLAL